MTWNWNNVKTIPQRMAASYLKRQGWVCFYLDEHNRDCGTVCWLKLYQETENLRRDKQ